MQSTHTTNIPSSVVSSPSDAPPLTHTHPKPSLPPRKRCVKCSMMSLFLLTSVCQVAMACLLVWLVGYFSALRMADNLTTRLRTSFMLESITQVESKLSATLLAGNDLKFTLYQQFPDLHNRTRIDDKNGYLAVFCYLAARWPIVASWTILNQHGLQISFSTPQFYSNPYALNAIKTDAVAIGFPNTTVAKSVDVDIYVPTEIHPSDRFNLPFTLTFDILPTDTPADIARYLGTPKLVNKNVKTLDSVFWKGAQEIMEEDVDGAYLQPFRITSLLNDSSHLSISGVSIVRDESTGKLGTAIIVGLAMAHLTHFLSQLPLGRNGQALLIQNTGNIVATSEHGLDEQIRAGERGFPIQESQDVLLQSVYSHLSEWGFISETARNESKYRYSIRPFHRPDEGIEATTINTTGGTWYIQSKALNSSIVGLPFALVIITNDSDFNGAVGANMVTSAWLAAIIVVLSIFFSVTLSIATTRPLVQVIKFLSLASEIMKNPNQTEHVEQLAELKYRWMKISDQAEMNENEMEEDGQLLTRGVMSPTDRIVFSRPQSQPTTTTTGANISDGPATTFTTTTLSDPSSRSSSVVETVTAPQEGTTPPNVVQVVSSDRNSNSSSPSSAAATTSPTTTYSRIHLGCLQCMKCLEADEVRSLQNSFGFMLASLASINTLKCVNEAKKLFIRYVFHEVRVPFSAMVLGIEQLKAELAPMRQQIPSSVYETMDILQEQSETVTRILNDVLSMQKIEAGAQQLELNYFSMSCLIRSIIYLFRQSAEDKRISVHMKLGHLNLFMNQLALAQPALLPPPAQALLPFGQTRNHVVTKVLIQADSDRLGHVISNFISNSVKFTPQHGTVTVKLEFSDFQSNTPHLSNVAHVSKADMILEEEHVFGSESVIPIGSIMLYVSVTDTGVGISDEDAKNLFQPYSQIASSHGKSRGTGLGLSIAKAIVKLHGGDIGVKSDPGKGSEFFFRVRLPIAVVVTTEAKFPSASPSSGDEDNAALHFQQKHSYRSISASISFNSEAHLNQPPQTLVKNNSVRRLTEEEKKQKIQVKVHEESTSKPTEDENLDALKTIKIVDESSTPHNGGIKSDSMILTSSFVFQPPSLNFGSVQIPSSSTDSRHHLSTSSPSSSSSMMKLPPVTSRFTTPVELSSSSLPKLTILVAEDSLPNRRLLIRLLESMNCAVVGVENGEKCCREVLEHKDKDTSPTPYDCIIMDGCMPVMDGLEATRKLRDKQCKIPIIGCQ